MSLADEIQVLTSRTLSALAASHDYFTYTQSMWRLLPEIVQEGRKFTFRNLFDRHAGRRATASRTGTALCCRLPDVVRPSSTSYRRSLSRPIGHARKQGAGSKGDFREHQKTTCSRNAPAECGMGRLEEVLAARGCRVFGQCQGTNSGSWAARPCRENCQQPRSWTSATSSVASGRSLSSATTYSMRVPAP